MKRAVLVSITTACLLFSARVATLAAQPKHPAASASRGAQEQQDVIKWDQKYGIMSAENVIKLGGISEGVQKTRRISDKDLAWVLDLMKKGPTKDTVINEAFLQTYVLLELYYLSALTPHQSSQIMEAGLPLLSNSNYRIRENGLNFINLSRDPKAISSVELLTNDSNPQVSKRAVSVLKNLERIEAKS